MIKKKFTNCISWNHKLDKVCLYKNNSPKETLWSLVLKHVPVIYDETIFECVSSYKCNTFNILEEKI